MDRCFEVVRSYIIHNINSLIFLCSNRKKKYDASPNYCKVLKKKRFRRITFVKKALPFSIEFRCSFSFFSYLSLYSLSIQPKHNYMFNMQ